MSLSLKKDVCYQVLVSMDLDNPDSFQWSIEISGSEPGETETESGTVTKHSIEMRYKDCKEDSRLEDTNGCRIAATIDIARLIQKSYPQTARLLVSTGIMKLEGCLHDRYVTEAVIWLDKRSQHRRSEDNADKSTIYGVDAGHTKYLGKGECGANIYDSIVLLQGKLNISPPTRPADIKIIQRTLFEARVFFSWSPEITHIEYYDRYFDGASPLELEDEWSGPLLTKRREGNEPARSDRWGSKDTLSDSYADFSPNVMSCFDIGSTFATFDENKGLEVYTEEIARLAKRRWTCSPVSQVYIRSWMVKRDRCLAEVRRGLDGNGPLLFYLQGHGVSQPHALHDLLERMKSDAKERRLL